jgi:hypothetical protein
MFVSVRLKTSTAEPNPADGTLREIKSIPCPTCSIQGHLANSLGKDPQRSVASDSTDSDP